MQAESAEADAAGARARRALKQMSVYQVFSSYYTLQTAARRVATADDLLASAQSIGRRRAGPLRAGVGGVLDLLTAQSALAAARAQQVQAQWTWESSLAQLAHDAGVLDVRGGMSIHLAPADSGRGPLDERYRSRSSPSVAARRAPRKVCRRRAPARDRRVQGKGGQSTRCRSSSAHVEQRSVPYDMTATGTVEPQQTVSVEAQVSGIITRVDFKEGDDVKQGQVLFRSTRVRIRRRSRRRSAAGQG